MKKTAKRILSAVLSICLLMSLVPMMASAADTTAAFGVTKDFSTAAELGTSEVKGGFWLNQAASYVKIANEELQYTRTLGNTESAQLRYSTPYTINGVIKMSFDLKFSENIPTGVYGTSLFYGGGTSVLSYNGNKVYLGHFNNGIVIAEMSKGVAQKIGLTFDFNEKLCTAELNGVEVEGSATLGASNYSWGYWSFAMSDWANRAEAGVNTITMSIDNFLVEQLAGATPTITSSISDGSKGVGVNSSIVLTLSDTIDTTGNNLDNIVLYDGTTPIETTKTVSGSTVTVTPKATLAEATTYSLVVGKNSIKVNNAGCAESRFSFTTSKTVSSDNLNFHMNFDNFADDTEVGSFISYVKNKSNYTTTNTLSSSWAIIKSTAVENTTGATNAGADEKDNIFVNGGKLQIKSTTAANQLRTRANSEITKGYVKIHFDFGVGKLADYTTDIFGFSGVYLYGASLSGGKLRLALRSDKESWIDTVVLSNDVTAMYPIDILIDVANSKATVSINNNSVGANNNDLVATMNAASYRDGLFTGPIATEGLYIDNLSIVHLDATELTSSVAEGDTDVSTVSPIKVSANALIPDSYWSGVTILPAANITAKPNADGYGATIIMNEALATNTEYTITFPALAGGVMDVPMAAKTVKFTTAAQTPELYVSDYSIPIVALGTDITASATFNYSGTSSVKAWIGIALFDANDQLKKVGCGEYTFENAESHEVTATLNVPSDIGSGGYIKIFAWKNGLEAMQPVCAILQN